MMKRHLILAILAAIFMVGSLTLVASAEGSSTKPFEFYPGATYDKSVPTLQQVVGHGWGEIITSHAQIERYVKELEKVFPTRVRLIKYAESWEGRALYYLVIASEANIARLDKIKAGLKRLADPRELSSTDANKLIDSLPAVAWLAHGVHGNEISSPDAALLTAYHLLAASSDELVKGVLEKTVVVIDPTQNPDGRDRFVNQFLTHQGRWANADPLAAERNEIWPRGRTNHYLFDMNRDWFAQTQPETIGRVKSFLEWFPVVYVDLHEMGGNSTYYFPPPALPYNPNITQAQHKLLKDFGKNNADWFDKFRFDYFTRDVFDSFYPGYGEGWPMFQGAIGMTYEQASARGLVFNRNDNTQMHFRETVRHHFIASLSTVQYASRHAKELLSYFYEYRRNATIEEKHEKVKEYILPPGRDPNRATKLAALLIRQGIEVKRADRAFENPRVRSYVNDKMVSKEFPIGTYVISLAQPAKHLAKSLLDKHTPQDKEFLDEQIRRNKKRLPDQFYDVTGWSLPLVFDVEMYMAEQTSSGSLTTLKEEPKQLGQLIGEKAHLAYLIAWGTQNAAKASAELIKQGVRQYRASRPFVLNNVNFPAGTLIIKTKDNPDDLDIRLKKVVSEHGAVVHATDRGWIEEGDSLGNNQVRFVEPPRVAMAWGEPTDASSAGWTRYLLEQQYGVPVTVIFGQQLRNADLSRFNVLILPNGSYNETLGEAGARKIKTWVEQGGTLITFGAATRWLGDERVGLLSTVRELKGGKPDREEKPTGTANQSEPKPAPTPPPPQSEPKPSKVAETFDLEKAIQPEREPPHSTPGAIFRARVDNEHWLGFGYEANANVIVDGNSIFTPIKLDRGTNVVSYLDGDGALLSGFTWDSSKKQIQNKAYLMHQHMGRGNVVAFAEDPNYRGFLDGLNVMFLNAAVFGPTYIRNERPGTDGE